MRKSVRLVNICGVHGQAGGDEHSEGIHVLVSDRKKKVVRNVTVSTSEMEDEINSLAHFYDVRVTHSVLPLHYDEEMDLLEIEYVGGEKDVVDYNLFHDKKRATEFFKKIDYSKVDLIKFSSGYATHLHFRILDENMPESIKPYIKQAA